MADDRRDDDRDDDLDPHLLDDGPTVPGDELRGPDLDADLLDAIAEERMALEAELLDDGPPDLGFDEADTPGLSPDVEIEELARDPIDEETLAELTRDPIDEETLAELTRDRTVPDELINDGDRRGDGLPAELAPAPPAIAPLGDGDRDDGPDGDG